MTNRSGVRVEIDHLASSRHGEDGLSWEDFDEAPRDVLITMIDDLIRTVAD